MKTNIKSWFRSAKQTGRFEARIIDRDTIIGIARDDSRTLVECWAKNAVSVDTRYEIVDTMEGK